MKAETEPGRLPETVFPSVLKLSVSTLLPVTCPLGGWRIAPMSRPILS